MKKRYLTIIVFALLSVLFLASSTELLIKEKEKPVYEVSVIIDTEKDIGWENFKLGTEEAAQRVGVDISFVTLYDENNPEQQQELVEREISSGAKGIILSSENLRNMEAILATVPANVPVIAIGSAIDSPRIKNTFSVDYEKMARGLIEAPITTVAADEKIAVVTVSKNKNNIELFTQVVFGVASENGVEVSRTQLNHLDECETLVEGVFAQGKTILVAPEIQTAKKIAQIANSKGYQIPLYSVGFSGEIWSYVENGTIKAIAAKDYYKAGYSSVEEMANYLGGKKGALKEDEEVEVYIIDSKNMYNNENKFVLFPIG